MSPLLKNDDGSNTITLAEDDSLKTTLSPYLLHDTFVVDLTTAWPGPSLCPQRSPTPQALQPSLGQCCILYLKLHEPASFSASAAAAYLNAVSEHAFVVCDEATLLDRKIWEFSDGRCPWFVWLDSVAQPIETAFDGSYQQHLVNLLCCRAKIEFAARASRRKFAEGFHIYQAIEYQAIEARASQIATLDSDLLCRCRPQLQRTCRRHPSAARRQAAGHADEPATRRRGRDGPGRLPGRGVLAGRYRHPLRDRRARGPQPVWAVAMARQTVQALTPGNSATAQQARANASRALMSPRSACCRAAM